MTLLAEELGFDTKLVKPRRPKDGFAKRPYKCGFDVRLARELRLPIFTPYQTVEKMKEEWINSRFPS